MWGLTGFIQYEGMWQKILRSIQAVILAIARNRRCRAQKSPILIEYSSVPRPGLQVQDYVHDSHVELLYHSVVTLNLMDLT